MPGRSGEGSAQMNIMRWLQKAVERQEWAPVIKEARALRGP